MLTLRSEILSLAADLPNSTHPSTVSIVARATVGGGIMGSCTFLSPLKRRDNVLGESVRPSV